MKKTILSLIAISSMASAQAPMLTDTVTKVLRITFSNGQQQYNFAIALGDLGGYTIDCYGFTGKIATLSMHNGVSKDVLNIDLTQRNTLSEMKTEKQSQCQAMAAVLATASENNPITITVNSGVNFSLSNGN